MEHFSTHVVHNAPICERYHVMKLGWPPRFAPPLPGQFLTIQPPPGTGALLRRPFAVSDYDPLLSQIEIVYERRGSVTRHLAACRTGERLDILAPLGRPFPEPTGNARPVLLAGGIGMGPMFFLATSLLTRNKNPVLILGARDSTLIPELPLFERIDIIIATDDGSRGLHGTSIDALHSFETDGNDMNTEYFACGPMPMLRALALHADQTARKCWVSIEQTMGCAVGACMGCVIPVHGGNGYARVCTEGPIFDSREIAWT